MAVKASVTITISKYRDTDSITRYYKLQASTAAAPAVPTTLTPSGWSTSEPTYTSGSTNTLYYTDCVVFSDGTFQYTDDGNGKAVKSSSYEAAKEAYNKAQAAQNTINNMEIGGRNLLLDSAFPVGTNKWSRNTVDTTVRYMNNNSMRLKLGGERLDVPGQYFAPYITGKQLFLTFYIMCPDVSKLTTNIDSWIGFRKEGYIANGAINKQIAPNELTDNVWKKITITGSNSDPTNIYCTMMIQPNNPTATLYVACPKLEYGSKGSDWTPAPEDIDNAIAKTVKTVDVEYYLSNKSDSCEGGSWSTTAPAWVDRKYMWSRQKVTYVDNTTATRNETCIAGANGATGTGVESIIEEYYLSTSKTTQTGGSWVTSPPTWSEGKYIWTRSKIIYKNPSSTVYTTPLCSSEWEAVNNIQIGGTNMISNKLENWVSGNWKITTVGQPTFIEPYNSRISYLKPIKIEPDTNYWLHLYTTKSNVFVLFRVCDINDNFIRSDIGMANHIWKSGANDYYIHVTIYDNGTNLNDIRDGITKIKIEKGTKSTDWSPAPEDLNEQFSRRNLLIATQRQDTSKGNYRHSVVMTEEQYKECTIFKSNIAWADIGFNLQRLIDDNTVKEGDILTYSILAKTDDTVERILRFFMSATVNDTNKSYINGDIVKSHLLHIDKIKNDYGWVQYYYTFIITNEMVNDIKTTGLNTRIECTSDCSDSKYIYWAAPKLEFGELPSEWCRAPEDIDDSIETVSEYAQNVANDLLTAKGQLTAATTRIDSLQGIIENFVKDDNGMVTVTQTGSGMQIDMTQATNRINQLLTAIESAVTEGEANQLRSELLAAIQAVQSRTAYINATQDAQGRPVITLGATDSPFKVEITNEAINFIQNGQVIAYANGQKFYNLRTVVQQDVQIGIGPGFIWKTRDSGNMGLTWVPAQS